MQQSAISVSILLLLATSLVTAAGAQSTAAPATPVIDWKTAERIELAEVQGITQWASGYQFVPPAVVIRPSPAQLWVVLSLQVESLRGADPDAPPRWRIAFETADGQVLAGERLGSTSGPDADTVIESTVYGLPAPHRPEQVVALRLEAPADAEVHAKLAEVERQWQQRQARIAALKSQVRLPAPVIGQRFDFDLPLLDGRRLRSVETRGRPLLIELWGTYCAPCVRSARELAALQQRIGRDQLQLLGIADDHDRAAVEEFMQTHGVDWPQHLLGDPDPELGQATLNAMGLRGVPAYLLLDADGMLRHVGSGSVEDQDLDRRIADLNSTTQR